MAALTKYTGGGKATANFLAALNTVAQAAPTVSDSGIPLLKMDKDDGIWAYGQDEVPVTPTARWA